MAQVPRAPRFRLVIDVTIEDADAWDPSEYGQVIVRLKQGIEKMSACARRNVDIREYQTIGDGDDYWDWRYHRGSWDASQHTPSITFKPSVGPIPPVDAGDLKALWVLMTQGHFDREDAFGAERTVSTTEIVEACSAGADLTALMARLISLELIVSAGLLSDWCRGLELDESVFRTAAGFPLERLCAFDGAALVEALRSDNHTA